MEEEPPRNRKPGGRGRSGSASCASTSPAQSRAKRRSSSSQSKHRSSRSRSKHRSSRSKHRSSRSKHRSSSSQSKHRSSTSRSRRDRSRSVSVSDNELRQNLREYIFKAALPPGRLYGQEPPKRVAFLRRPVPAGKLSADTLAAARAGAVVKGKSGARGFAKINPPPPPRLPPTPPPPKAFAAPVAPPPKPKRK